jgi:hypothetical protein
LVGKPEGKIPLGRPRCRCDDDIKMDLRGIGFGSVNWIFVAQDRDKWRALLGTVMNLRVRIKGEKFLDMLSVSLASQEGLCSTQVVTINKLGT